MLFTSMFDCYVMVISVQAVELLKMYKDHNLDL